MTYEDQDGSGLRSAFAELTPGHGTQDLLSSVHDRMRTRRRTRTAWGAASLATGVGLAVVVSSMALADSSAPPDRSADSNVAVLPGEPDEPATVTMSRSGEEDIRLSDFTVTCEPVDTGQGTVEILRISTLVPSGERSVDDPFLAVQGGVDKLAVDSIFELPLDDLGPGSERTPLNFEALAWYPTSTGGVGVSTTATTSRGTVEVIEASCGDAPSATLRVDLRLDSDPSGVPVHLKGIVSST